MASIWDWISLISWLYSSTDPDYELGAVPRHRPGQGAPPLGSARIAPRQGIMAPQMPVSEANSRVVYEALKASGVRLVSALPETWLVHLIRMAEDDPEMILVRLAKEEEGVGISMGA